MNAQLPTLLPDVRVKSAVIVVAPKPLVRKRRRSARGSVIAFVITIFAWNFGLAMGMDHVFPTLRDPEYGRRLSRLKSQMQQHPNREFTIVLGSSRTAFGLRPAVANSDNGPLIFNFAQVGSGPVMQLMTLRRLLHDGIKPNRVILEYWPPFLREDGSYSEERRIDKHRLLPVDELFVSDYFDEKELTFATMRHLRKWPWYEHRLRLLSQIVPNWLTYDRRQDAAWQKLDAWGWLPGFERDPSPEERDARHLQAFDFYGDLFRDYQLNDKSERAMQEIFHISVQNNIRISFVWLPESTEFRSWYSAEAKTQSEQFLARIRAEYGTSLIDARQWVPDPHLADGFHLTQPGATIFSQKFGEELRRQP